jgi:ribosomal protein L11 methyltransferase
VDAVASSSVDLALANISPEGIVRLAPDLLRVLRPGGLLIASGFEKGEVDQVQAALPPAIEVRHKNNWSVLVTSRS